MFPVLPWQQQKKIDYTLYYIVGWCFRIVLNLQQIMLLTKRIVLSKKVLHRKCPFYLSTIRINTLYKMPLIKCLRKVLFHSNCVEPCGLSRVLSTLTKNIKTTYIINWTSICFLLNSTLFIHSCPLVFRFQLSKSYSINNLLTACW